MFGLKSFLKRHKMFRIVNDGTDMVKIYIGKICAGAFCGTGDKEILAECRRLIAVMRNRKKERE